MLNGFNEISWDQNQTQWQSYTFTVQEEEEQEGEKKEMNLIDNQNELKVYVRVNQQYIYRDYYLHLKSIIIFIGGKQCEEK